MLFFTNCYIRRDKLFLKSRPAKAERDPYAQKVSPVHDNNAALNPWSKIAVLSTASQKEDRRDPSLRSGFQNETFN